MDYKVRKQLEMPLKIKGMYKKNFYIYCGLTALYGIIGFSAIKNIMSGRGFIGNLLFIVVCLLAYVGTKIYLVQKSNNPNPYKRYKTKETYTITNRDLFKTFK